MTHLEDRILQLLEQDCSMPHAVLAARCGVDEADIDAAVKKLEDEGIILG